MSRWVKLTSEHGSPVLVNLDAVQTIAPRRKRGSKLAFGPNPRDFVNVAETIDDLAAVVSAAESRNQV